MERPLLTLRQFIRRQQTLCLYRDVLRAIREIDDIRYKREVKEWVHEEFKKWKYTKDEDVIHMLLSQGRIALRELKTSIEMAK